MRLFAGALVAAVAVVAPAASHADEAWVTYGNDSIGAFDVAGGSATRVNPSMLPEARALAITPRADRYWMGLYNDGLLTGTTSPFSGQVALGTTTPASDVDSLAVSPDGTRVYVTRGANLLVVDAASRTVVDTENVVNGSGVAVAPDGRRVYVKNASAHEVYVYDVATRGLLPTTIAAGDGSSNMAVTPDGRRLVLNNNGEYPGTVTVVDLATSTPMTVTGLANAPRDVALSPDGRFAYVLNGSNPNAKVIDVAATPPAIVDTIAWTTANDGVAIAVTPDGSRAFVADRLAAKLQVLNLTTRAPAGTVTLDGNPSDVAMLPRQGPHAAFTAHPGVAGSPTTFNAGGSRDPDGSIARYSWDFGDGTTLPDGGPSPTHTYAAPGTYNVTLSVTDDDGVSTERVYTGQQFLTYGGPESRASTPVTVDAPAGPPAAGPPAADPPARDSQAPSLTLNKPRNGKTYKRGTFRRISGTALDQASPGATAAGVGNVKIGLQKRVGKRCRPLRKGGKLGKARPCSTATPLKAKGTTAWSYKLRKRLPKGRYVLRVTATDRNGATSRTSVRFKLR